MAGLAQPVLSQNPRKQALGGGGCCCTLGSHRSDPRSHTPARRGLASQLPFHLAPVGGFSGSSCGAEKGENGAHPQLFPAWLTLG